MARSAPPLRLQERRLIVVEPRRTRCGLRLRCDGSDLPGATNLLAADAKLARCEAVAGLRAMATAIRSPTFNHLTLDMAKELSMVAPDASGWDRRRPSRSRWAGEIAKGRPRPALGLSGARQA